MSREGWICPSCGNGVSPDHATCDHGVKRGALPVPPGYAYPAAPSTVPQYMVCCGCPGGTGCMNVACPNRMVVTCSAETH